MDIKRQGINVGPESVLDMISGEKGFRAKDGSFDKQLFRRFLEQQRLSESAFIAQGQEGLARQLLLSSIDGTPIASQSAVDALFKARAQKRILDVVTVDAAKLGGIPDPGDKALHEFYDANQSKFATPEYRGMTVATLSTESLAKDISVSDYQVKKEYDAKREQLSNPERRDVVQVVLQDEDKAKQLAKQARASKDLAEAARELKEKAVPLDRMEEKNLIPELSKAVFALREGEIGDPVKTQLGWHVVQLKKISPAGTPDFDTIKEKLREDMRRDQSIEAATRIVNQLDDQLAAGHSLDDIADGLKLRLIKIPAVDAQGMKPDGKEPSELPNKDRIVKDAFAQNAGETSPVEDDKSGTYYVVRTDEITPSGVKPFEKARDEIAASWKAHEQTLKAQAEASKIAKALGEGGKISAFDDDEGVSSRVSQPLSLLGDTDKQLPPSLVAKAFKLKRGETATDEFEGKQIVARHELKLTVGGRFAQNKKARRPAGLDSPFKNKNPTLAVCDMIL